MSTFDNTSDTINSRDIIKRIEELESELSDAHQSELDADTTNLDFDDWLDAVMKSANPAYAHENHEDIKELLILRALAEDCENCSDWEYGELLIRESYFTDYIEELINDCCELPKELTSGDWPYRHITIDYEAAAEEDKCDYTEVDFDGVTYLIRS